MIRLLLTAAVTLTASAASGQVFMPLVTSPLAPTPEGYIGDAFDVDGDGRCDLVVSTPNGPMLYRNEGFGRFVSAGSMGGYFVGTGGSGDVGDIDGDNDLDVAIGDQVFENLGDGTFAQLPQFLPQSLLARFLRFIDYDGDNDLDILSTAGMARLWQNDGTGTFTAVPAGLSGLNLAVSNPIVSDVDGDGDADVVMTNQPLAPLNLRLWRNTGTGSFTEEALPSSGFSFGNTLSMVDIDGDGDQDLLITLATQAQSLLLNDGAGNFAAPLQTSTLPGPEVLATAVFGDWNQDGLTDIVGQDGVYENQGGLQFSFAKHPYVSRLPLPLFLIDVDGDLDLDLVTGSPGSVILNTGEGPIHAARSPVVNPVALGTVTDHRVITGAHVTVELTIAGGSLAYFGNRQFTGYDPIYHPLRPIYFPSAFVTLDAAMVRTFDPSSSIAVCTTSGVRYFRPSGTGIFYESSTMIPPIGTPTHVGSGDFDGQPIMDLVFGDPTVSGPRILTGDAFHPFMEQPLTLPPAAPSPAPAFETVQVADMDGDGDMDIVHELRVVQNDGNGAWSVGAEFTQLVPANAEELLVIDYDTDGDMDLIVYGASATTLLLQNDGTSFQDASIGHLPPAEFAPTDLVSAADIDNDGDMDLLTARNGSSNLLSNDNGVFHRTAGVGPRGVILDTNNDGYADLFTGPEVWINRYAHLHEVHVAVPGVTWPLQVHAWRPNSVPQAAWVAIGTQETLQPIPGIGVLRVHLDYADVFPVAMSTGTGSTAWTIPLTPLVLGIDLISQAIIIEPSGLTLTSVVRDRVR